MFKKFKPFEASSRIEFKDPDTGFIYIAKTLPELYVYIQKYRVQNGLPALDGLREVVENYLCTLPENRYKCNHVEVPRSFSMYIKGGIALLKNMAFSRFVPQKVAEERAAQCVGCEHNVFPDKGPFMRWADEIAVSQVGERKTALDAQLGNCAVCSCVLRSKCHYGGKLDPFPPEELVKLKSVKCWQLKLSGQE